MKLATVLTHESKVLSRAQREHYFEYGYTVCEGALDKSWLGRVRRAFDDAMARSAEVAESDHWFALAPEHQREAPCVLRIQRTPDQDPDFWAVAAESCLADIASDVLGPDVIYRDSSINVKPPGARGNVGWHQDFPFYPHTNVGTIQVLTALYDIPSEQGPMTVLPGSHRHCPYEHYDEEDRWLGEISERDLGTLDLDNGVELVCAAGDTIVLHPLTVHGSKPNCSNVSRPLLINGYSAGDSLPYTSLSWGNSHTGETVRGDGRRYAQHDELDVRLPPDWSSGYTSIFEHQQSS